MQGTATGSHQQQKHKKSEECEEIGGAAVQSRVYSALCRGSWQRVCSCAFNSVGDGACHSAESQTVTGREKRQQQ